MTTKTADQSRVEWPGAISAIRNQLVIVCGLVTRADKAYRSGYISAKDVPDGSADTVVENLVHIDQVLERIEMSFSAVCQTLEAEYGVEWPEWRGAGAEKHGRLDWP